MELPKLQRNGHASHCVRCLTGLGPAQVELDTSRMAVGFYCIASLDVLGVVESRMKDWERENTRNWIWDQQIHGSYGTGFRAGSAMSSASLAHAPALAEYDLPDLIMTYTALLLLSILRDPYARLERDGIVRFLRSSQLDDGSFSMQPNGEGDADLRTTYCAFAIASMLDDWTGIDVERAVSFVLRCQTYEGGFGQRPGQEAVGGTTYCALAALTLAASSPSPPESATLSPASHAAVVRWLVAKQIDPIGGFCGRTEKLADACYSFWCGAALAVAAAGTSELVDTERNAAFLASCQFGYGGISKCPDEQPDPFHTYMALAALSIHPPRDVSWKLAPMDPVLNATIDTAAWARAHIPKQPVN